MGNPNREQPHIIADRVATRLGANRLRKALGLKPIPVTTKPDFRSYGQGEGTK